MYHAWGSTIRALSEKRKAFHEHDGKVLLPREDFNRMTERWLKDDCSSASQSSLLSVTNLLKENLTALCTISTLALHGRREPLVWSWVAIHHICLIHKFTLVCAMQETGVFGHWSPYVVLMKPACTSVMKKASCCHCVASFMDWNKLSFPGWLSWIQL